MYREVCFHFGSRIALFSIGMRTLSNFFLIAALLTLNSLCAVAVDSCQTLFQPAVQVDNRYGTLQQFHPDFLRDGYVDADKSMLCGPVCIHNVVKKFEVVLDARITVTNETRSLYEIVDTFKDLGISLQQLKNNGVSDKDLMAVIDKILTRRKIPHEVQLLVASDNAFEDKSNIQLNDLTQSLQNHSATILLINSYATSDPDLVKQVDLKSGHYVIVKGYNNTKNTIIISDPRKPEFNTELKLTQFKPKNYTGSTFQVSNPTNNEYIHVIGSLIKVKLGQPIDYLKLPRNKKSLELYNHETKSIRSADQLITFIKRIKDLYEQSLDRSWGEVIQNTDLASILVKIRNSNPNDPKLNDLRWLLEQMNFSENLAISTATELSGWTYPLLLVLDPKRINELFQDLSKITKTDGSFQSLASHQDGLSYINSSFIQFLKQLPVATKNELLKDINLEFSKIDLEQESLRVENNFMIQPESRIHRRNLEVLLKMLTTFDSEKLIKSLSLAKHNSLDAKTEVINQYYRSLSKYLGGQRGNYSFTHVIKSAEIIRRHLGNYFNNENSYIEMYGSFVNGKANFKTSDIDVKLSEPLFYKLFKKSYRQVKNDQFYLYFKDYIQNNKISTELSEFWQKFQIAEKDLADKVFVRAPKHPSEVLAMLYPVEPFTEVANDSRWYNPITLRIFKDHLELHIIDLMGKTNKVVIPI